MEMLYFYNLAILCNQGIGFSEELINKHYGLLFKKQQLCPCLMFM